MEKLLVICGPTATGKTALAASLAHRHSGELISADSRQVYRQMDIGTGKDYDSLGSARIWLYDVVDPDDEFSVNHFVTLATQVIGDIRRRSKLPIVVGGTGLYIKALTQPLETISVPPDTKLRERLKHATVQELQRMVDPSVLSQMNNSDRNNPRRLIRKIELSGSSILPHMPAKAQDVLWIGLTAPLSELKKRIHIRIEDRIRQGAQEEFKRLRDRYGDIPALLAPGYRSVETWEQDEISYAKRQLTWFAKQPGITWFDVTDAGYAQTVADLVGRWYTKSE